MCRQSQTKSSLPGSSSNWPGNSPDPPPIYKVPTVGKALGPQRQIRTVLPLGSHVDFKGLEQENYSIYALIHPSNRVILTGPWGRWGSPEKWVTGFSKNQRTKANNRRIWSHGNNFQLLFYFLIICTMREIFSLLLLSLCFVFVHGW